MHQTTEFPTLPNNSALSRAIRVKLSGGYLVVAGDEDELGTVPDALLASDASSALIPRGYFGTRELVASEAISQYAEVFAAADGKVASSGTRSRGIALEAASGDGSIIRVLAT